MSAVDSLPYYDQDLERIPGLRERIDQEIQAELQASTSDSSHPSLPTEIPQLFQSNSFLTSEVERVSSSTKVSGLDSSRYSLPAPPASASSELWQKALDNASSQLEHQNLRLGNLEVMSKYGANAWRVSNYLTEKEIERLQAQLEVVKRKTEEVNRERKSKQLQAGDQLSSLEQRWTTLVSGNLQLELANMQLELEVETLREREEELQKQMAELNA